MPCHSPYLDRYGRLGVQTGEITTHAIKAAGTATREAKSGRTATREAKMGMIIKRLDVRVLSHSTEPLNTFNNHLHYHYHLH